MGYLTLCTPCLDFVTLGPKLLISVDCHPEANFSVKTDGIKRTCRPREALKNFLPVLRRLDSLPPTLNPNLFLLPTVLHLHSTTLELNSTLELTRARSSALSISHLLSNNHQSNFAKEFVFFGWNLSSLCGILVCRSGPAFLWSPSVVFLFIAHCGPLVSGLLFTQYWCVAYNCTVGSTALWGIYRLIHCLRRERRRLGMNDPFWNQVLSSDDELFDVEVATVRNDGADLLLLEVIPLVGLMEEVTMEGRWRTMDG
ncbi:hypothetical protein CJ030_MR2G019442 [Morella rubra]|uniref:Uncharacterized protein n=1 Tax=Morella rubra TaxID=262757 RepID=A0A6A1WDI4_9ROSI|nr:hypothetical protein CJ030_MR2G019442 [Morella rubra]